MIRHNFDSWIELQKCIRMQDFASSFQQETHILQELGYQTFVNDLIDKHIEHSVNNQIDSRLVWDVLKIEICDHIIMYCKK